MSWCKKIGITFFIAIFVISVVSLVSVCSSVVTLVFLVGTGDGSFDGGVGVGSFFAASLGLGFSFGSCLGGSASSMFKFKLALVSPASFLMLHL